MAESKYKGLLYSPEVLGGIGLLTAGLSGGSPDKALPSLLQGMQTAAMFRKQEDEDEKQRLIKEYADQVPADQKNAFLIAPGKWLEKNVFNKNKDRKIVKGKDGYNYFLNGDRVLPGVVKEDPPQFQGFTKDGEKPKAVDLSTKDGQAESRKLLENDWIPTNVSVQASSVNAINSKGTNTKLEKEIVDAKGLSVPLSVMKNQFEPGFLTYKGELGSEWSQFRERMGFGKDDSLQKFTARRNQWLAANNQFFNNYRKAITGVAAGEKEIGYLKQSIPSDDDSASVYMAKLDQQIIFNKKLIERNERALKEGIIPELDSEGKPTGKYKDFLSKKENAIQVSKEEVINMAKAYKEAEFSEKITQFKLIQDFGEETVGKYFNLLK